MICSTAPYWERPLCVFLIDGSSSSSWHCCSKEFPLPVTPLIRQTPMNQKNSRNQIRAISFGIAVTLLCSFALRSAVAADRTWDGGGDSGFWGNPFNWNPNAAPVGGDSLFFRDTTRLNNTNDFGAGTSFSGITFMLPSGAFNLYGNQIALGGGITNNQPVTVETINLPLTLSGNRNVQVAQDASLRLAGVVSGGFGLSKSGPGLLTLSGANTFGGPLTVNGGTVEVSSDGQLGTAPGSPTPGNIVLNSGALRSTATMALNTNRGIALGPTAGSGQGRIEVNTGTLTYGGVMANNGGTGGLTKGGASTLTLSSVSTYTGPTSNRVGNLTLDFTTAGSPGNNIISTSSALSLGGENTGIGTVNNIQLTMEGKASTANVQTFGSTFLDVGSSVIRANSGGTGGSATLALNALNHNPGGTVTFFTPTSSGGSGNITTSSGNLNGILGGWALWGNPSVAAVNSIIPGLYFAAVDGSGNIVQVSGQFVYASGNLAGQVTAQTNLFIAAPAVPVRANADLAGTTTDVNSLTIGGTTPFILDIGTNNILRFGRYGGIFVTNVGTVANTTWEFGNGVLSGGTTGSTASQNAGTITAGGAPNTDGELVFTINSSSQTANNSIYVENGITDNGSGRVSVVKTGPGPMKFRGHNSFSGNMYILQGRIQMAGSELANGLFGPTAANTANPDAFGTGDIYVLPGGQAFPSGAGGNTNAGLTAITNNWFIAGNGVSDNVGAIRLSGVFSNGVITLIGDARLGGGGFATGVNIYDRITGNFNLDFGATGNSGGGANGARIFHQANDWTGNTSIVGRTGGTAGNTCLFLGNNEVIPNGFGKGNLILGNTGNTSSQTVLDLNGFNETVNGLISFVGTADANKIILNNGAAASTLTVGDNDQSSTFAGIIQDGSSPLSITKIGAGVLTLAGNNTYSGPTIVNGGTLALSGSGAIASSIAVNSGAVLDITGVATFSTSNPIDLSGGILRASTTGGGNITTLNSTNGRVRVTTLSTITPNLEVSTLTTGGPTNYIDVVSLGFITSYPIQFPIINYGTLAGVGNNFGIGAVPRSDTQGYISNNLVSTSLDLVLTNGPKGLTWTGLTDNNWNIGTTNWLFGATAVAFANLDSVLFNDSSSVNTVNIASTVQPSAVVVTNTSANYSFVGGSAILASGSLTKDGAGTLTIANSGVNSFSGGLFLNNGTIQVGTNGTGGNLSAGNVVNNGALIFSRSDALTETLNISGPGSLTQNGSGILTLGGNSSYEGLTTVAQGTLRAASATAFGSNVLGIVVNSGATLDVNGQNLTPEAVTVSGAGVGGNGAIINTGAEQQNALLHIVLTGNTTFGGTGRWDIRGTGPTLDTGGNAYNLTKVGTNQFTLVGVSVDAALANIDVQAGTFAAETITSSLGNPTNTLTVAAGATLQFFNSTTPWDKVFLLSGNGTNNTINIPSGAANTIQGPITLTGGCIVNNGTSDDNLTINGTIGGAGSLTKNGGSFLAINGVASYPGGTVINGGILVLNNNITGGGALSNAVGTAISGQATNTGPVRVNGALLPGGTNVAGFFGSGALTLNSAQLLLDLGKFDASFNIASDQIVAGGTLTANGVTTISLSPGLPGNLTNNQVITIIRYSGGSAPSATNFSLAAAPAGYAFSLVNPATTPNEVRVRVDAAPSVLVWLGGAVGNPTAWNVSTSLNWSNTVGSSPVVFTNLDGVNFTDTQNTNRVTLIGDLAPGSITMNNPAVTYTFDGSGRLTGTTPLDINLGGRLIIANTGSNIFTGPINISSGILQVGNGGAGGNLGSGPITNFGALVFNRTGTNVVNNSIAGNGPITNLSPGVVTLGGANTYDGEVVIASGATLRSGSATALGSTAGFTTVNAGGTLDVGGNFNMSAEQVTVSGAGVGGLGAIINSGAQSLNALGTVNLAGDTTFGGTGRWDIRAFGGSLNTGNQAYNLTKVGTNQVSLVGISVDPALANINVQAGTLSVETNSSLGSVINNLTVAAGATLQVWNLTTPLDKPFVFNGNGTNTSVNAGQGSNNNIGSTVNLNSGEVIFNSVSGAGLQIDGAISGAGSLTKSGPGFLVLNGANSYTGNTRVNAGTLFLTSAAEINSSPAITVAGGVLDVTGLTAGPTLVLQSGQVLAGSGSINGSANAQVGSIVAPGLSTGVLTVSNSVTLAGTARMELDRFAAIKNDRLNAAAITFSGGALILTNIGALLQSGDSFTLFGGSLSGSIGSVTPPALWPGLSLNTSSLNSAGTVSIVGTIIPPQIVSSGISGTNFVLSGSGGLAGVPCYVVASTNVALPLANWTRVATNAFNASGNVSISIPISPNVPKSFYRLLAQ